MRFHPLERLINLYDGYRRHIKIDQLDLVLAQEQGQLYIFQSRCPHRGQPLEQAAINDGRLVCPLHQYVFDLGSGAQQERLCAALTIWVPIYEGNQVGIAVEDP